MPHLKIKHSILLKPKNNQNILNLPKLQQALTKFPSWILITYNYSDQTQKSQIIHLDNPLKNLQKQSINNQPFFKGLVAEFNSKNCQTIEIIICKN